MFREFLSWGSSLVPEPIAPLEESGTRVRYGLTIALVLVATAIPIGWLQMIATTTPQGPPLEISRAPSDLEMSPIRFRAFELTDHEDWSPRVTNVNIVDLDENGEPELLVCDAVRNTIFQYQRLPDGSWKETALVPENTISVPARTEVVDLDGDNDPDILVAVFRSLTPTSDPIGQVVLLQNNGDNEFTPRVLIDQIRRVSDARSGDFDGDGDLDLVVAEYGHEFGRIFWMENRGDLTFVDRELMRAAGTVSVSAEDFDGDGDPDVAAFIPSEQEEVWIFENTGEAPFQPVQRKIWGTANFDFGGSEMLSVDLDEDGDLDLLLAAGEDSEYPVPTQQSSHGVYWLENLGDFEFELHSVGSLPGCSSIAVADIDNDNDLDIIAGSRFNNWHVDGTTSLVWFENDGEATFQTWKIADSPARLATVACGDLTGNGQKEIIAGSLFNNEPIIRPGRVTVWTQEGEEQE
ncbi:FG-GAP repeat protein [Thalassoglobus neptunius]|uniref:FG-GAP repeat protein n=1 Tax=Thalassoglobus neptunius TaxID=1938619 RepID=A0A5C5X617_9PLAN|nr:FG-GAP and VCBS repeat-containing protein [Thalassoglobus neptunius]TWT58208.1 FG-GAP repeat protein [Thalassoglobus neptunius]